MFSLQRRWMDVFGILKRIAYGLTKLDLRLYRLVYSNSFIYCSLYLHIAFTYHSMSTQTIMNNGSTVTFSDKMWVDVQRVSQATSINEGGRAKGERENGFDSRQIALQRRLSISGTSSSTTKYKKRDTISCTQRLYIFVLPFIRKLKCRK